MWGSSVLLEGDELELLVACFCLFCTHRDATDPLIPHTSICIFFFFRNRYNNNNNNNNNNNPSSLCSLIPPLFLSYYQLNSHSLVYMLCSSHRASSAHHTHFIYFCPYTLHTRFIMHRHKVLQNKTQKRTHCSCLSYTSFRFVNRFFCTVLKKLSTKAFVMLLGNSSDSSFTTLSDHSSESSPASPLSHLLASSSDTSRIILETSPSNSPPKSLWQLVHNPFLPIESYSTNDAPEHLRWVWLVLSLHRWMKWRSVCALSVRMIILCVSAETENNGDTHRHAERDTERNTAEHWRREETATTALTAHTQHSLHTHSTHCTHTGTKDSREYLYAQQHQNWQRTWTNKRNQK